MKLKDLKIEKENIELGGHEFDLSLDMNALVELEDVYGNINKALDNFKKYPMKELRVFLYAMLKEQIEDLTIEATGSLVTAKNMNEIFTKVTKTIGNAFLDNKDTNSKNVIKSH